MRAFTRPLALALLVLSAPAALAQGTVEKTLALEAGGRFVLDTVGSATLAGSDRSGAAVTIRYDGDLMADYEVSFTEEPGLAKVTVRKKDRGAWGWFSHGSSRSPKVSVALPARARVEASTAGGGLNVTGLRAGADLDSAGGSVEVADHAGGLEAEASGGSVRVLRAGGDVKAESAGGGIVLEDVTGSVTLASAGGSIRVERVAGKVTASAAGGGVEAVLSAGNAAGGTIESAGGSIRVAIDPAVNLSLDATASGGSVSTDLPVRIQGEGRRTELRGDLGRGGPVLRLESSGGGIRVEALPAR